MDDDIRFISAHWPTLLCRRFDRPLRIPKIGNMLWRIRPNVLNHRLSVFMEVDYFFENYDLNLWNFVAEIAVEITDKYGTEVTKRVDCRFERDTTKFKFENLFHSSEFGLEERERIELKFMRAHFLRIKHVGGFHRYDANDFWTPKNTDSEIVLIVEDDRIYVDKYILMHTSSVFREMLSNNDTTEIEIPDIPHAAVISSLRYLYGENQKIITENMMLLAEKYDVPCLKNAYEDYLNIDPEKNLLEKLKYAEKYNFSKLQMQVIYRLPSTDIQKYFKSSDSEETYPKTRELLETWRDILGEPRAKRRRRFRELLA